MKKKLLILSLLSLSLITLCSIQTAYAYFTTYASARGQANIHLGYDTIIEEELDNMTKHISVRSEEGSIPVYVRVRYFAPEGYSVIPSSVGNQWIYDAASGYWYYPSILLAGETTPNLDLLINVPNDQLQDFNVIVVSESVPVTYDAQGNPEAANWNQTVVIDRS